MALATGADVAVRYVASAEKSAAVNGRRIASGNSLLFVQTQQVDDRQNRIDLSSSYIASWFSTRSTATVQSIGAELN